MEIKRNNEELLQTIYLGDGRVGRSRCDKHNRGGGGVVSDNGLLDVCLYDRDVAEGAHGADPLEQRAAVHHPTTQKGQIIIRVNV